MSKHIAGRQLEKEQLETKGNKHHDGTREFVESVVIAIILAFLFRAFEAEAFVIPTGSMAPTLMGQHKDVICKKCFQPYQTSASHDAQVATTTCPTCRYVMTLKEAEEPDHDSFSGDRILVSKFAYQLAEPERWDVIVFKFPGNAKQNYIKRLIGLPGETIRVQHGDIHVKRPGAQQFRIAQRPPHKIRAMLQIVHDNDHQAEVLNEIGWPQRWHEPTNGLAASRWQVSNEQRKFAVDAMEGPAAQLYYRHTVPSSEDWTAIEKGRVPPGINDSRGHLITDFCAYNANDSEYNQDRHWVGDIALEFELQVAAGDGTLTCTIVESGAHYQCEFDLAQQQVTFRRADGQAVFSRGEETVAEVTAESPLTAPGSYHIRLANVDDTLCLWVDGSPLIFKGTGPVVAYQPPAENRPHWSLEDPGDLAPARLRVEGLKIEVASLKIMRDIYYVAIDRNLSAYERSRHNADDYDSFDPQYIRPILDDPTQWAQTELFAARRTVEVQLQDDEFFPMGDNSAASLDGRLWDVPPAPRPAVPRELMIGKALMVYWPHTWNTPVPFTPNPQKIRLIK